MKPDAEKKNAPLAGEASDAVKPIKGNKAMAQVVPHGVPLRQEQRGAEISIVASNTWPYDVRLVVDASLVTVRLMRRMRKRLKRKLHSVLSAQWDRIAAAGASRVGIPSGLERFAFESGRAEYGFRIDPQVVTPRRLKEVWCGMVEFLLKLLPIQRQLVEVA